ncbi:MAG TPA: hypothetical protein VKC63_02860 [Solirubrobacterales bacterium]|nr:hypothetical protein [Solirubrobacterales bacterium]
MSLDGLRAWIGEVERKLGMRTRVFLALTVIAIGIGGAAIYLAIDARESSVSESDVQALQERLEARIDELAATASTPPAAAETEPKPKPEAKTEAGKNGAGATPKGATGGAASAAKLQELLERAKEKSKAHE